MRQIFSVLALLTLFLPAIALADSPPPQNWPQWRGPDGNGVSPDGDPPIRWSETENVRFKVPLPGLGLASPVVWDDKIFILSAVAADDAAYKASQEAAAKKLEAQEWPPSVEPVKQAFVVLAFSREDGKILWQQTAAEKVPHESHYIDASWASASPITDGKRLFAHFGSNGLYAYDLDGKLLWARDLGDMRTRNGFGEGASPALDGDTLIVNWDHEDDSFIVALDANTGEERWRTARPDEVTSWSTPLVVEHGGRKQVVVAATGFSRGYDFETGEELWRASGMTVNTIPSPVHRDGVVYLASGYRGNAVQAIDLAKAKGVVNDTPAMVWTHDRHTPYVPSLLLYDNQLYFLKHFKNIFTSLDAASGEVIFTEKRLPGITNVYASPVGAAGRVYIIARDGQAVVLKHGRELEVLAENHLDDGFEASPAIVGNEMYLRGRKFLYAISDTGEAKTEPAKKPEAASTR